MAGSRSATASNLDLNNASNVRMSITSAGNVGIGITKPTHSFDVSGAPVANGAASESLGVYDTRSFAAGVGGQIAFGGKVNAAGTTAQNRQHPGREGKRHHGDTASAMLFFTHANAGAPAERMRIGSDGLLTIGATGGTGLKLAVNGSIRSFSGGFQFPDGSTQASAAINSQWGQSGSSNLLLVRQRRHRCRDDVAIVAAVGQRCILLPRLVASSFPMAPRRLPRPSIVNGANRAARSITRQATSGSVPG